jgi:beta-phosphoglucomutase-like phosphatase (HAD superfamily)
MFRPSMFLILTCNNSGAAIASFLADHRLADYIKGIVARDDHDPERMRSDPYRVRQAVGILGAENTECALAGDSLADVMAGHLAGVAVIGYADKPGKAEALADAPAAAVTTGLAEISTAPRATHVLRANTPCAAPFRALPPFHGKHHIGKHHKVQDLLTRSRGRP